MSKDAIHYYIIGVLACCFLLSACAKLSDDSTFDGQWRLTSIDYINPEAQTIDSTHDVSSKNIYWSFQSGFLCITVPGGITPDIASTMSPYRHDGDSLYIQATYAHFRATDSLLADTTTALSNVGLPAAKTALHIDDSHNRRLTLQAANIALHLKKY